MLRGPRFTHLKDGGSSVGQIDKWIDARLSRRDAGLVRRQHSGPYRSPNQRLEYPEAVPAAKFRLTGALRMRHHSQNIASRAANAGNIVERPIRIRPRRNLSRRIAIAKNNSLVAVKLGERRPVAEIIAIHVSNRDSQNVSDAAGVAESRVRILHPHLNR